MEVHVIGEGELNWNRHERVCDRYGAIGLYDNADPWSGDEGSRTINVEAIDWTPEKLRRFKEAYELCIERGHENFEFDGHAFFPGYAKYLIEYLESQFNGQA